MSALFVPALLPPCGQSLRSGFVGSAWACSGALVLIGLSRGEAFADVSLAWARPALPLPPGVPARPIGGLKSHSGMPSSEAPIAAPRLRRTHPCSRRRGCRAGQRSDGKGVRQSSPLLMSGSPAGDSSQHLGQEASESTPARESNQDDGLFTTNVYRDLRCQRRRWMLSRGLDEGWMLSRGLKRGRMPSVEWHPSMLTWVTSSKSSNP